MPADPRMVEAAMAAIATRRGAVARRPLVVGLCGAQGSGKSTLAEAVAGELNDVGIATAILSLDDLYKTRAERAAMAAQVHPLFRTRGVPGTHDVAVGEAVLTALQEGRPAALPRFDKAADDRSDATAWPAAPPHTQVLIFEGWFVGAVPQPDVALADPVNALERDEDGDGRWRRFANAALADYRRLFARIDLLIFLAAPSFEVVRGWRAEQERALRARSGGGMADREIERFVAHYERLTRHVLDDLPRRADLVLWLGAERELRRIAAR